MEINSFDQYGIIETALNEVGLAVVDSVRHGKKAVITVIRNATDRTTPVLNGTEESTYAANRAIALSVQNGGVLE